MRQPADDAMTPRRVEALCRLAEGTLRLGDLDVKVRRALIACGKAARQFIPGEGWRITITDAGIAAHAEWDKTRAAKEKAWRKP